jgi:hypothetical protein
MHRAASLKPIKNNSEYYPILPPLSPYRGIKIKFGEMSGKSHSSFGNQFNSYHIWKAKPHVTDHRMLVQGDRASHLGKPFFPRRSLELFPGCHYTLKVPSTECGNGQSRPTAQSADLWPHLKFTRKYKQWEMLPPPQSSMWRCRRKTETEGQDSC